MISFGYLFFLLLLQRVSTNQQGVTEGVNKDESLLRWYGCVLKAHALEFVPMLSPLFCCCLKTKSFPPSWKHALVQHILKKRVIALTFQSTVLVLSFDFKLGKVQESTNTPQCH